MQNLILEGLQQKLQKSCSRSSKNTWHVESSYILQPPKYLLLFVNRFRYINNDVTKDRCPIPMDTTVRLGPLKFRLRATIDHHGPSIHSGHYIASINCCKKHSIATQLRSLELLIKTPLLHKLYHMNWLTHDFWTRKGGWVFDRSHGTGTSSPSHWQQVEEQAPNPIGLSLHWRHNDHDGVSNHQPHGCLLNRLFRRRSKKTSTSLAFVWGIHRDRWIPRTKDQLRGKCFHLMTSFLGSARSLGWMPLFVFFGLPIVSCSLIKV